MLALYETMSKVLDKSQKVLKDNNFNEHSPFPEENNYTLDEALSLVYENCLLYSDIHLRYILYTIWSYQLKLMKMRAELANLNHCAVPFLSCAVVNLSWKDSNI